VKTYAPKTRTLAADVILEAAVREALRLIRDGAVDYEGPEDLLLAAGQSAALLLGEDAS
jgi:hypothetical protein